MFYHSYYMVTMREACNTLFFLPHTLYNIGQLEGGGEAEERATTANGLRRIPSGDCNGHGGQEKDEVCAALALRHTVRLGPIY